MLEFKKSSLLAATHCASKKDLRYYLEGVLIECTVSGDLHIVATDGHIMFCGLIASQHAPWLDSPAVGPWQMIVPAHVIKRECKGKGTVLLNALPDGRYQLGDTVFSPIDGRFPDWRRVVPDISVGDAVIGQYDHSLVSRCNDALSTWFDWRKAYAGSFMHHRDRVSVITGEYMTGFCVIMALDDRKLGGDVRPFTPAKYE